MNLDRLVEFRGGKLLERGNGLFEGQRGFGLGLYGEHGPHAFGAGDSHGSKSFAE
jgi:hypothetical protein